MERMITRTIQKKVYTVMTYDTFNKKPGMGEFVLTEKIKDDEVALKLLRKRYEGEHLKIAAIVETHIEEKLYALSEVEFLKYAHPVEKGEVESEGEEG